MALKVGELFGELGLDDKKFYSGLDKAEGIWKEFGNKIGSIAKTGAKVIGGAMAGVATAGLLKFAEFEKGMNEVFTLLPDISEDAMRDMSEQVKQFSKDFKVLPDKVVPALYQAISAGVPQDNVFEFLKVAQKAAVGGVTELETAVDGITSVINAYGQDVISAAEASDLMFTAVRLGKTNFEELSNSLYNVIPTASSLGVQFEDITAALASMTAAGTPTSVATTQLRQALVELSKDGSKAADTFKLMAGKTFREFIAEGGNLQGALQVMERAAQDLGIGVNDLFGSVEAGNAVLSLTGAGTERFTKNLQEMANAAGATDQAYSIMDRGISRAFDSIKTKVSVLLINVGEKLAPTFERFAGWLDSHMPEIENIVVGTFDAIVKAIDWVSENVLPKIIDTYNWVKNIFQSNSDEINSTIQGVWDFIVGAFGQIQGIIETFIEIISVIWAQFGDDILEIVETSWGYVKESIGTALDIIGGLLEAFAGLITGDWERMNEGLKNVWENTWKLIEDTFNAAAAILDSIFGGIAEAIGGAVEEIYNKVKEWLVDKFGGIIDGVKEKIEAVAGFFQGLYEKVVGHSYIPDLVKDVGKWMEQLDSTMVAPAEDATFQTKESFANMKEEVGQILADFQADMQVVEGQMVLFGETEELLADSAKILETAIQELLAAGIEPTNPVLKAMADKLKAVQAELDNTTQKAPLLQTAFENAFGSIEQFTRSAAQGFVSFFDSVAAGDKTMADFGSFLKEALLKAITALEVEVIAAKAAGIAAATAQAPLTFGASLAMIPGIIAAAAPAFVAFETAKAVIRGLAEGGTTLESGWFKVGERGPELLHLPAGASVVPLGSSMTPAVVGSGGTVELHQHGVFIYDEFGIKWLERKLQKVRTQENIRRGVSN